MGLSIRAYARHRGVSDTAVRKAIKAGRIKKEPDGTIDPAKADAAWERNTNQAQQRKPSANQGSKIRFAPANQDDGFAPPVTLAPGKPTPVPKVTSGPDYQTSRAVKETYAARLAKLDFEERSKKLVNADEVRVAAFNLGRRVRDRLMTIPHRMGSVLASGLDSKQIEEILEKELRTALE